ncbi:MAG: MBL fold metallo-hydrolase, partial [Lachnospiraceae bacterium]|nr:MBL fold metallo-hydrolase [Lachnospiraceae bacterium]
AVEATGIFLKNGMECYDDDAKELVKKGINPITFPGLKLSITSEESKAINFDMTPKVILSASGMCEAGRIRHHLKHNLWRPECTILFVGYQAIGTLGRALIEGVDEVRLFGEPIEVRASIKKLAGISGHADRNGLLTWIGGFENRPTRVFIVHGEDTVTETFAQTLIDECDLDAYAPFSGTKFDLISNTFDYEATGIRIEAKKLKKISGVFNRLMEAGQRLIGIIKKSEGMANKDLAKFADQINSLCDKWDR